MSVPSLLSNTGMNNNAVITSHQKYPIKPTVDTENSDEFVSTKVKRKKQLMIGGSFLAGLAVMCLAARKGLLGKSLKKVFGAKADDLKETIESSERIIENEIKKPKMEMTDEARRIYNVYNNHEYKWTIDVVEGESKISRYFRELETVSDIEKSKKGLFKRIKRGFVSISKSCENAYKKCFSKRK